MFPKKRHRERTRDSRASEGVPAPEATAGEKKTLKGAEAESSAFERFRETFV